ncbi:TPA: TRAP transporter permease [Mannheimia haemolytica]|nr:TRAP transporter permease [Mannheimia haemolytica]HDL1369665.1 TRAP transporter permease [Mannheimia haemolytica]
MSVESKVDYDDLQDMVASNDSGGRTPSGLAKKAIVYVAILWSVFQIYYASPLPFVFQEWLTHAGINLNVVVDDTKARSIHLAFAMFLAFLSYPAFASSPKHHIPKIDWVFAIVGAGLALYYIFFYEGLVKRFGAPNTQDIIAGCLGILLVLEATRRSLGLPLVIIAIVFLIYNFFGQYFPADWIVSHRSGSLSQIINQQWITTEGVFGVALGVSTKYVFLFVLFGALLDKAGAGNYFIKTAFAYLGHLRGGPAKAAVVSSALTGLISGSSIANVVTTGTFTIPMMKRVGFTKEKAGAVEVASSVNGQIIPPVMGAAAFLMIEYVNMPYSQLITHAFLPALISYIALVYIVHLEACKMNLQGLPRAEEPSPILVFLLRTVASILVIVGLAIGVYYGLGWIRDVAEDYAFMIVCAFLGLWYLLAIRRVASYPDLEADDPNSEIVSLPKRKPTVNAGLHYLIPVVVLLWCLMVEMLSPGLSAFWGTITLIFIQLTQRPLLNFFRKESVTKEIIKQGVRDVVDSLEAGGRNMTGIALATATAGIIVGVVALTGFGVQLSSVIELLSMGNIVLMLILVAVFSLILGMGLPTTANYIVVSSLMATVIMEVGRQNGLIVPLIAVHLFVFYFGIMADVTPPVGLASFAAAAISGGSPINTGMVAFKYSLRTVILPFLFIFNTDLLLIDLRYPGHGWVVFITATVGVLAFTSATMQYIVTKNKWWETALLVVAAFALFRPGFFMDRIYPSERHIEPVQFEEQLLASKVGQNVTLKVEGLNPYGKEIEFYAQLPVPEGATGEERLKNLGLTLIQTDEKIKVDGVETPKVVIDMVEMDSPAAKAGLNWDQTIHYIAVPQDAPSKDWIFIPALLLVFGIVANQRRRVKKQCVIA